jgi:lipoprotein NlpD
MLSFPRLTLALTLALLMQACTVTRTGPPAPLEIRAVPRGEQASTSSDKSTPNPAPVRQETPGPNDSQSDRKSAQNPEAAESDNKPAKGFYVVKQGDTLIKIALDHGQSWRDLAAWNQLPNPNVIDVGQQLRVVAPSAQPDAAAVVVNPVVLSPAPGTQAVTPSNPALTPGGAVPVPGAVGTAPAPAKPTPPAPVGDDALTFAWPAQGSILAAFDEKNKGIDIGGKAGDPVLAAADGRVVYAGSGLRGYGNLIILKHNNTYLTAYAHNQSLSVKEDQVVRKGQKIAEMGKTDSERVKLHFEIRKNGKPVDPARFLAAR